MSATASPVELSGREERIRGHYDRFCDALAGYSPMPVRVSMAPTGNDYCMDVGVWARYCRPDPRAPEAASALSAVLLAAQRFWRCRLDVRADERAARFLHAALDVADRFDDGRCAVHGHSIDVNGSPVAEATLLRVADLAHCGLLAVTGDDAVDYRAPLGDVRTNARWGMRAEAAYHCFCRRRGYELVSVDGSAHDGASGWAWWSGPGTFRAVGRPGGTSRSAELDAVCAALDAHRDVPVAVTTDYQRAITVSADARAGIRPDGLADDLVALWERVASRPGNAPAVLFPLSSGSSSPRQSFADTLAKKVRRAASRSGAAVELADGD